MRTFQITVKHSATETINVRLPDDADVPRTAEVLPLWANVKQVDIRDLPGAESEVVLTEPDYSSETITSIKEITPPAEPKQEVA